MYVTYSGLIPGLRPANERRRYFVTTSLIGRAQAEKQPCDCSVPNLYSVTPMTIADMCFDDSHYNLLFFWFRLSKYMTHFATYLYLIQQGNAMEP